METYKLPPRAEIDRLLAQLLPSAEEMEKMSADELRDELALRAQRLLSQGVNVPRDLLEMTEALLATLDDVDCHQLPTCAQLEKLIEMLLPPDEEMDDVSAALILDDMGADPATLGNDLREKMAREFKV